jgi:hypothetical protein
MDTETAASPAGGADTSAHNAQAPAAATTEAQAPAGGTTEGATTATDAGTAELDALDGLLPAMIDEVEVDYEGAKYKVPAPLKDALLRQSDYTRKTMELGDQRRAMETAQRQVQEAQQLSAAEIRSFARLDQLNTQLAEFNGINWADLDHSSPEVQRAKGVYEAILRDRNTLNSQIDGHMQAKAARAERESANEREATDKAMATKIKDWGPEKRQQFVDFAVSKGIPADLAGQASAAEFDIIRLAMIGSQTETQRLAALRAAAAAKTQPAPELGGPAGAGPSDPAQMSMEQYRAWRAKQTD